MVTWLSLASARSCNTDFCEKGQIFTYRTTATQIRTATATTSAMALNLLGRECSVRGASCRTLTGGVLVVAGRDIKLGVQLRARCWKGSARRSLPEISYCLSRRLLHGHCAGRFRNGGMIESELP